MKKLLLLLLCTVPCLAQIAPQISGAGAPSNPCFNGGQQYVDTTNHVIYACPSNGANWVNIGGGNMPQANIRSLAANPSTCSTVDINAANNIYYNTASAVYRYCSATNTWTTFAASGGTGLGDPGGNGIVVRTSLNTTSPVSVAATAPVTVTNADGTGGNPTLACATCTTNAAALTSNAIVLGGGSQASKVVAGLTTDGTAGLNVGATGVGGTLTLFGATSGSQTFTAPGNGTQLTLSALTLKFNTTGAITTTGSLSISPSTTTVLNGTGVTLASGNKLSTTDNCSATGSAANPSVAACAAAFAGSFSCATNASTGTCVVNTTAVSANSEIFITQRTDTTTGTRLSVTCNTAVSTVLPVVTAVTAATSFTINLGTITTNPECFSYFLLN